MRPSAMRRGDGAIGEDHTRDSSISASARARSPFRNASRSSGVERGQRLLERPVAPAEPFLHRALGLGCERDDGPATVGGVLAPNERPCSSSSRASCWPRAATGRAPRASSPTVRSPSVPTCASSGDVPPPERGRRAPGGRAPERAGAATRGRASPGAAATVAPQPHLVWLSSDNYYRSEKRKEVSVHV